MHEVCILSRISCALKRQNKRKKQTIELTVNNLEERNMGTHSKVPSKA